MVQPFSFWLSNTWTKPATHAFLGMAAPRIRLAPVHNGHLIEIKALLGVRDIMVPEEERSDSMPLDVILVVFIAVGFGIFAATLFWADLQTRGLGK